MLLGNHGPQASEEHAATKITATIANRSAELDLLCGNHLFVAQRPWKLASHAVTGFSVVTLPPERTAGMISFSDILLKPTGSRENISSGANAISILFAFNLHLTLSIKSQPSDSLLLAGRNAVGLR